MDLALNNLEGLICYETHITKSNLKPLSLSLSLLQSYAILFQLFLRFVYLFVFGCFFFVIQQLVARVCMQ